VSAAIHRGQGLATAAADPPARGPVALAPSAGRDTESVLRELGLDDEQIAEAIGDSLASRR
jgi:crotonobetainyl-CoA:carnitine CoA-transferase CaiB-like acyl-CoA transferase